MFKITNSIEKKCVYKYFNHTSNLPYPDFSLSPLTLGSINKPVSSENNKIKVK